MKLARSVLNMKGSVYSHLAQRLADHDGPTFPLHIGDTWMEPAEGCRLEDIHVDDHAGMHRYASVHGRSDLLEALTERAASRTGLPTSPDGILVSAGGTGGLCGLVGAIVEPGDEVVVLAPHWPLIAGMVRAFGGTPVQVPFIGVADSPESAVDVLESARTDRTVAVYWNTPNNPTGQAIPASWLAAMAEHCRRHDLWIFSDEVYEEYVYTGDHVYSRPFAPERTVSIHSFSKSYGMAGNRVGYLVGPAEVLGHARKITTHTFYSAPTGAQIAALRALGPAGTAWVDAARAKYAALGAYTAERLGVSSPDGSTFVFLDVADALDDTGLTGLLEKALERGLLVAPGPSFGPYPTHVRLCFTSAEPERVRAGVDVLADLLGRPTSPPS